MSIADLKLSDILKIALSISNRCSILGCLHGDNLEWHMGITVGSGFDPEPLENVL